MITVGKLVNVMAFNNFSALVITNTKIWRLKHKNSRLNMVETKNKKEKLTSQT